jgi:ABC-type glycerol-3-phosphate transport system substrate-binding protein
MMKRLFLGLVLVCLFSAQAMAGQVTLNVASEQLFRANMKVPYQTLLKIFEQKHPNIKINAYGYPLAEFHQKIITEIAAGNAPDVLQSVAMTFFSHAMVGKGYMPLEKYLDQWGYLGGDGFDKAIMADFAIDGKISALPVGGSSWGYAYWKPAFKEAGINAQELQTWDDLIAAAKKLTIDRDKDGRIDQYGLGLTTGRDQYDTMHWEQLAWSIDGGFFPSDQPPYTPDKVSVNTPASLYVMELLADAVHKHKVTVPGVWTSEKASTDLLMTKKAAIVFVHLGMIEGFKALKPEEFGNIGWIRKMSVNWQGKTWKPGVNIGWAAFGIRNEIPKEKLPAALEFMKFFGSPEGQTILAEGGNMPVRKDVTSKLDPVKSKHVSDFFAFHSQFYKHIPRHSNPKKRELYSRFGDTAYQKILVEGQPVKAVLDRAQEEIVDIMKK